MIVPMKKAIVLMQAKDAEGAVKALRGLGVLHLGQAHPPQGKDITALQEEVSLINSALGALQESGALENNAQARDDVAADWKVTAKHIIDLWKRYDQLAIYLKGIGSQLSQWERWGDFEPARIEELLRKGIYLKLYRVPEKQIADFPAGAVVQKIFSAEGFAHCLVISQKPFESAFKELTLPRQGILALKQRAAEDEKVMETIKIELFKSASFYKNLLAVKRGLEKDIEFQQVLSGMGKEGVIAYLSGYIPIDSVERLLAEAKSKKWAMIITEPAEEENVPTLLRAPRWARMINPVLQFLGVTPGYHELDVSVPFLLFFSLFFGILIGDAGYGLVYLLITFCLRKKMRQSAVMKNALSLFYLLSSCAITWGILTGTFFGQEWLLKTGYKPPLPKLNDPGFMQGFCFFLGALHLSIAHSWRAYLKLPSLSALADIGWVCVLWTAFFLARTLIIAQAFPAFGKPLLFTGIGLVIFFTNPQKNIFKSVGEGLGTIALSLMNNFTDVVSYVRLFAVGLAGVAIAETTNSMAAGLGSGAVAVILGVLIVVVGHALNIVLGPMSVLVHGVRLNVLEFSGHANVTWSGQEYAPLKD
jgi:V/A-type H+/Na+-transporting ATPase subunit I